MVIIYNWLKKTTVISLFFTVSNNRLFLWLDYKMIYCSSPSYNLFFCYGSTKLVIICLILYINCLHILIVIIICYLMTCIIVTEILIKPNRSQDKNHFCSFIIDPPLIHSLIPNHNAFLSAIMYCLTNFSHGNINITLTSTCTKVNNRENRFVNSCVWGNTVCTPVNGIILDIHNCVNNFIRELFG